MAQIPADLGGMIRVVLRPENGRIGAVEIVSSRPVRAARIFVAKPLAEMTGSIGRVFSLCGKAQTVAALRAGEAALDLPPAPGVEAARDVLRLAEMMTQTAMRLALHWPRVLGLAIRPDLVRTALAAETALADPVAGPGWTMPGAGVAVGQLPDLATLYAAFANDPLLAELQDALAARGVEEFGAAGGSGLAARLAVSGKALTTLPHEIAATLAKVEPTDARPLPRQSGQGRATVNTARGPLTHRVWIENGIVTDCQIEAPTEANFAPDGPVVAGLAGAVFDPVAAELLVLAIDPCVACSVEVSDA